MARGLLGKKIGMTQVFDQEGQQVPVTVLELGPNQVIQVKTHDGKDGYDALKVGYGGVKDKHLNRPRAGVFHHAKVDPARTVREFRVAPEIAADTQVGDTLTVEMFQTGQKVDITGISKGKGFAGVIKRHGFKGAKESSHGTHEYKRHAGSIGCSADPARVVKGKRMAGQMGNTRVTTRSLTVVAVYPEDNLLLVKGAVPGPKNGLVRARVSAKQPDFI